jgi:hypothetical protein
MKRLLLLASACLALAIPPAPAQEAEPVRSAALAAGLERLMEVPVATTVHQSSSHNREGFNGDDGWHLYDDERGHAVIFDATGPGCVRSLWSTDIREDAVLHFTFDDEDEPRFSIPMLAFYRGEHPLFPAPLASLERRGYWGERPLAGNCFVPIPFAERLRISVSGELHFYHVLWESYAHGARVRSFDGSEDRSFVLDAFADAIPVPEGCEGLSTDLEALEPGQPRLVLEREGPGCVRELVVEGPASEALIRDTWISMAWDGHLRDDVRAPLGTFFGSAVNPTPMRSLPLSVERVGDERVRLRCRFPMPFARSARIALENRSDTPLGPLRVDLQVHTYAPPTRRLAHFTTLYREGWTTYGRDWLLAETPGAGWYVGTVQTMLYEHYCEGDEHFTLDGAISPQIHGTGTEDYYLACFWSNPAFDSPFACCVGDVRQESGSFEGSYGVRACYARFHLEAPIPFYSHLDARIQHGGFNTIRSSYSSLGYAYLRPRPALVETDLLDVGSPASEAAHGYSATASEGTISLTARGEGRHLAIEHRDSGRRHSGGEITFRVALDPTNRGVRLRRRLDQASPRQTAEVWLDGERVGVWYHADHNPTLRWYDSDFDVHPRYTFGKESLEVRLVPQVGEGRGAFTDFRYRVYCFEG